MKRSGAPRRKTSLERKPVARRSPDVAFERPFGLPRSVKPHAKGLQRPRAREPGEAAWKRNRHGRCASCGVYGRLLFHHILREQDIRRHAGAEQQAAGVVWDQRNALSLGAPYVMGGNPACRCHANHHAAVQKLSVALVSPEALVFAVEILGAEQAEDYFDRCYAPEKTA